MQMLQLLLLLLLLQLLLLINSTSSASAQTGPTNTCVFNLCWTTIVKSSTSLSHDFHASWERMD
jgi:hypothetical protein